jgi:hypothetical protein
LVALQGAARESRAARAASKRNIRTMPERMSREDFEPHLNTTFRLLRGGAEPLELELIEITGGEGRYENSYSFALLFRGGPHFLLQQHTFTLEHAALGTLDLFLVPVSREPDGYRYEAVFNYTAEHTGRRAGEEG